MNKQILMKFGKNVRENRVDQHLSQEELADKAGLHRNSIARKCEIYIA